MDAATSSDSTSLVALRCCELFAQISDEECRMLMAQSQQIACKFADIIPAQKSGSIYVVISGKIRLIERQSSGAESTLCMLEHSGDFWMLSWAAGAAGDSLIARASEESILLRVQESALAALSSNNAAFKDCLGQAGEHWRWFSILRAENAWQDISAWQLNCLLKHFHSIKISPHDKAPTANIGLGIVAHGAIELAEAAGTRRLLLGDYFVKGDLGSLPQTEGMLKVVENAELIVLSPESFSELSKHRPELLQVLLQHLSKAAIQARASANVQPAVAGANVQPAVEGANVQPPAAQAASLQEEKEPLLTQLYRLMHQYPILLQQSQMDCGITCIAMVALFNGKRLDINDLRERAGVSIEGTSMLSLAETAEHCGFITRGIRGTYAGLLSAKLPLICFWKQNHFVVLYEINEKYAIIGDPAEGLLKVSREEFTKNFSKSVLELVPTVELKRAPGAKNPLLILLPLLKPYGSQVRDIVLAGVVFQILMMITPFFTQTIVDRVIVHEDISMLNMLLIGMILVTCFQSAITFTRGILIATLATKIDHALFVQFFKHLFSLPLKFFEQRSTGDILARFNENAKITAFLSGNTVTTLLDGAMTSIYMAVLFWYSWVFGLGTVLYIALLAIATFAYTPLLRGYSQELFKKTVANDSCVIESVHGVEKIKSAAAENRIRWKWELIFVDKLSVSFRQQLAYNGYSQVTQLVHLIGRLLLMWLGAHLVISNQFTVGQYMAANMMSGMVVDPVMRVIAMWQQLQGVNISVERLGDVFRAAPEETGVRTRMPELQGHVELRNVTFRYNEHAPKNTLLNVSFAIHPNQMIAIVGRSGCGKTTIARLIQGLYLPVSGSVLIDGMDTAHLELSDLRKRVGVVAQQEFFFSGTVRENLAFYRPDAPLDEIVNAARIAGVHDKIKALGSGYDTMLSEGGQNLSGGERQRLAIARALLHNPRILIFDEATSALDSESERHIQSCMEALRHGRTMLVIAHRLSTIKSADLILVVEQGQIVEAGDHKTLLLKNGLYHNLCSQQSI